MQWRAILQSCEKKGQRCHNSNKPPYSVAIWMNVVETFFSHISMIADHAIRVNRGRIKRLDKSFPQMI